MKMEVMEGSEPTGWRCSKCGCTEDDCSSCVEKTGAPCWWVEPNLCSACVQAEILGPASFAEFGPAESTTLQLGTELDDPIMPGFLQACRANGMIEAVCCNCGRPWLTRPKHARGTLEYRRKILLRAIEQGTDVERLCPVCDPDHPGYEPGGPTDRARWFNGWRSALATALAERAQPVLQIENFWIPELAVLRVECRPPESGEICGFITRNFGRVYDDGFHPRARRQFAKGTTIRAWCPHGDMLLMMMAPAVEPDKKKATRWAVPFARVEDRK